MKCHFSMDLHGRALSNASGIKAANPLLNVVAIGVSGAILYGEGEITLSILFEET